MDIDQSHAIEQLSVLDTLPPKPNLEFKNVNSLNDFFAGFYYYSSTQAQFSMSKMVHKVTGEEFNYTEHRDFYSLESNFIDFKFIKYIPEGTGSNWQFKKILSCHDWCTMNDFPGNIIPIPIFTKEAERSKQFTEKMVVSCGGLCGKKDYYSKFSKCGKCKIMPYCSKECQQRDWPNHKKKCFV